MTAYLTVDLTASAATVLSRREGAWRVAARLDLPDDSLPRRLADVIADEGAAGAWAIVYLPPDQADLAAFPLAELPEDAEARLTCITDGLAARGRVPPARARLDMRAAGGELHVAAVAEDTLTETAGFLGALGLRPAGFGLRTGEDAHGRVFWFGPAEGHGAAAPAVPLPTAADVMAPARPGFAAARERAIAAARRDPGRIRLADPGFDDDPDSAERRARIAAMLLRKAQAPERADRGPALRRAAVLTVALIAGLAAAAAWLHFDRRPPPVAGAPEKAAPPVPVQTAALSAPDPQSLATGAGDAAAIRLAPTLYTPAPGLTQTATGGAAEDIAIPGIDTTRRIDALALPAREPDGTRTAPAALNPPPPASATFAVDDRGFVIPHPEGRAAPEGYTVYAGPPPATPPQRPARLEEDLPLVVITDRSALPEDNPLRTLSPRQRPDSLVARNQRARLGGKTRQELALLAPEPRPASPQETAPAGPPTAQAVTRAPRPGGRSPEALAAFRTAHAAAAATSGTRPSETTAASDTVQQAATSKARIDLSEINLLGTYGRQNAPRALVRLPSGRVVNVAVGDRMDGGRVAGIGDGRLDYTKGGERHVLRMPSG